MSQTATAEYFELFDLPVGYDVDTSRLAVNYQRLQAEYHPDRFANAEAKIRRAAVENAALINQAHETLKDALKRGFYMLKLAGVRFSDQHTVKDTSFLMQQMTYRERLEEVKKKEDPLAAIDLIRIDLAKEEKILVDQFKSTYDGGVFDQALDNLTKLQFFGRLKNQLDETEADLEDQFL